MTTPIFHLVNDQFLRLLRGQVSQEDVDNILHTLMAIGLTAQTAETVANTLLCAQVQEPFGHFKPEPFGWTDCSKDAEGAIALYEHPAKPAQEVEVGLTDGWTSVRDKLPSDLGLKFVEFYSDDLRNPTNQVIGLYEDSVWWSGGVQFCNVTHWKPLTPAPIAALRAKGGK